MKSGIYEIVNTVTGCRYIGSAKNIKGRWTTHRGQLVRHKHHSKYMQRSWNKYGPDIFRFSVLLYCNVENLIMYEQRCIDGFKPEYNSSPTAGSQLGLKMSKESRAKLSESAKRTKNFTGKTHSEESRKKISESRKGKGLGPQSEERRARIGAAHKGRIIKPEWRAKISATLTGHKQSPEQIAKRVLKLRGRKMPAGFAEATSKRITGSKLPPAHCENIGKSKATLSDGQVSEIRIRRKSGERINKLCAEYGIGRQAIRNIIAGNSYKWVT